MRLKCVWGGGGTERKVVIDVQSSLWLHTISPLETEWQQTDNGEGRDESMSELLSGQRYEMEAHR